MAKMIELRVKFERLRKNTSIVSILYMRYINFAVCGQPTVNGQCFPVCNLNFLYSQIFLF